MKRSARGVRSKLQVAAVAVLLSALADRGSETAALGAETRLVVPKAGSRVFPLGWQSLHGGAFTGPAISESPDPLARYRWNKLTTEEDLQFYYLLPETIVSDTPKSFAKTGTLKQESARLRVEGTGSIRLDFGRENAGWLEFDSPDLSGEVEMSISEYSEPAIFNHGSQNAVKTRAPVRHGQTYRLELNQELYEGVRFGWIHVRRFERPWHITGVRLVCQAKPANYTGSFACSDPVLTRAWYAGAYAVRLNFLKDYIGAILMERSDRHSWTGDAFPTQAAALVAFANWDYLRLNLERTADIGNQIESYPLYWVLSLTDYYRYTGDAKILARFSAKAEEKLKRGDTLFADPVKLGFYGWDERLGAGFENHTNPETRAAYRMLWLRAGCEFAAALRSMGRSDESARWESRAGERMRELRADPGWHREFGLHAAADAVNTGMLDPAELRALAEREFTDRVQRLSFSPFNQYFVMQALAGAGMFPEAFTTLRDCWGGQLDYGATTFFEVYRPFWNRQLKPLAPVPNNQCGYTSLCHPWSSGVTKWLTEEVLGIQPLEPGFKRVSITPRSGGTLNWVEGSVLTPTGEVRCRFDFVKGLARVRVPQGSTCVLGIPKEGRTVREVSWNGTSLRAGSRVDAQPELREEDAFVFLDGVPPGEHEVRIRYSGRRTLPLKEKFVFPGRVLSEDSRTQGEWSNTYGRDGHLLFNYFGAGQDARQLPAYVQSVAHQAYGGGQWQCAAEDKRALRSPRADDLSRQLGFIRSDNPLACRQSFTVDIQLLEPRQHRVALYFADGDEHDVKRVAVEAFDLATKKLLIPTVILEGFSRGKYLSFELEGSTRFRVYHIRGNQAVLSGIFFDPVPNAKPLVSSP